MNRASPRYHWSLRHFITQANDDVMERLRRRIEAIRAFSKTTGLGLVIYDERSKRDNRQGTNDVGQDNNYGANAKG